MTIYLPIPIWPIIYIMAPPYIHKDQLASNSMIILVSHISFISADVWKKQIRWLSCAKQTFWWNYSCCNTLVASWLIGTAGGKTLSSSTFHLPWLSIFFPQKVLRNLTAEGLIYFCPQNFRQRRDCINTRNQSSILTMHSSTYVMCLFMSQT